ncbi:hypothetical protein [Streptomyces canus]|uniref:hypothetical protein n=1 Tax=Streptomyces canus TaxID=58343 RepID=UPI003869A70A
MLNVVSGNGPVSGRALGLHPDVDMLSFTGPPPRTPGPACMVHRRPVALDTPVRTARHGG